VVRHCLAQETEGGFEFVPNLRAAAEATQAPGDAHRTHEDRGGAMNTQTPLFYQQWPVLHMIMKKEVLA
jgi:hypothetical protein